MAKSIPDSWDMDQDPTNNPQQKRKGSSSPTQASKSKKKPVNTPNVPTNIDPESLLGAAADATKYACELVEGLAEEYHHEDEIGPCLNKVAKALDLVCRALLQLSKERHAASQNCNRKKVDAETNTEIALPTPQPPPTPHVPGKKQMTKSAKQRQRYKNAKIKNKNDERTPTHATPAEKPTTSGEAKTIYPEQVEEPFTVVDRTAKTKIPPRTQTARKTVQRSAAVLVKVPEGRTYADTLRAVRQTDIDFEGMGTHVTSMRKTRNEDLLVELTKGAKATAATSIIRDKLAENMSGSVVTRLRHTAEVEITDLDEVATKEEVLAAIQKAILGDDLPSGEEIKITGLWATRDSRQMATATVPIAISRSLTSIRVGWTQCRVRPRRPEPAKCYRCHGYGHGTRQCTGPDLSHACRRCGQNGHTEAICTEGADMCVACDRIKSPRVPHKPGSGACAARRAALAAIKSAIR
ncbi:uncharacterized protein LOC132943632 [Metopolophium dirhodum]|uniref:uncharacterized protein LOC132943632 n=1 Tax=Metopolophium dirhodum TaxID=44670 RepID=UPI002990462E|nr:uncharacterized protein LOC132943632 [Metopolophium dirhodum]